MLAAVPYRGPDGLRICTRGSIALGHAKLATTPEAEGEWQPLVSARTGCAISADVRLDNRADLLARLPEGPDAAVSDAEIILRAYDVWGLDAVARLLGDFAFVLWDPREHRILCARDTGGQRTLFYRVDTETCAVASEIHQLLQDPAVPVRPNVEYIHERLLPLNMFRNEKDAPATYFDGIRAVPAGHMLTVDAEKVQVKRYWAFKPPSELRYRSEDEYAEHFRHLFFNVVQARLRSAQPIGVLLSGGLDSSSIMAAAHQVGPVAGMGSPNVTGLSAVFGGLECDERPLIQDMQVMYGFDARYIMCENNAGRLQLDSPGFLESPNLASRDMRDGICRAAVQADIRVLLTGDMADNCVTGSRLVFDSLLRQGRWQELRHHWSAYRRVSGESLHKTALFAVLGPLLPLFLQSRLHAAYLRHYHAENGAQLLPAWMPQPLRESLSRSHLERCLALEQQRCFSNPSRHAEYNLLYPPEITRHPAPWPVEIWRPFADRRLHEFLLAIPPEQKFTPHPDSDSFYAGSKRVMRQAMHGILPESIRTRQVKTVFESQFRREVQVEWPLYEAAFGPSASPEIVRHGYADHDSFWARLARLRDGEYGQDLTYVLQMVGLETWLRALRQPRTDLVTVPSPCHVAASQLEILGESA